jgi:hypothetical protein
MELYFTPQSAFIARSVFICFVRISEKNREDCPVQHSMIGSCNRDTKCLLRGTTLAFMQNGLRFVLKGLNETRTYVRLCV